MGKRKRRNPGQGGTRRMKEQGWQRLDVWVSREQLADICAAARAPLENSLPGGAASVSAWIRQALRSAVLRQLNVKRVKGSPEGDPIPRAEDMLDLEELSKQVAEHERAWPRDAALDGEQQGSEGSGPGAKGGDS
jgi:hypothetical protein